MKRKIALALFFLLLASIHSFAEASDVVAHGRIVGNFNGYKPGNLYTLTNNTSWIQMENHTEYAYSYNPDAVIIRYNGNMLISVQGAHKAVHVIPVLMTSKLTEDFNGWDGNTILALDNGTIWQQAEYYYAYSYKYRPDVYITEYRGEVLAMVEGLTVLVPVERIK